MSDEIKFAGVAAFVVLAGPFLLRAWLSDSRGGEDFRAFAPLAIVAAAAAWFLL